MAAIVFFEVIGTHDGVIDSCVLSLGYVRVSTYLYLRGVCNLNFHQIFGNQERRLARGFYNRHLWHLVLRTSQELGYVQVPEHLKIERPTRTKPLARSQRKNIVTL